MNEDFVPFELAVKLEEKGFNEPCYGYYHRDGGDDSFELCGDRDFQNSKNQYRVAAPTIPQVLKWLREEKNIDIEIHADVGMLGIKVYSPYICTYTEFALETSPDVVRYRQKKFNPTTRLPHEIIPAHVHFKEWEQAALAGIEYVLDNLI